MAVCPTYLVSWFDAYIFLSFLRDRKKELKIGHSGMQSVSYYSPLNCSSSTYFDVLSDILSFAGQCAFVVSHLMIPGWAAREKEPLKSIQVKSITASKEC